MSDHAYTNWIPLKFEGARRFFNADKITSIVYPIITFVILLVIWESTVNFFQVPEYIFPRIKAVLGQLYAGYVDGLMYQHLAFTLRASLTGLLIGCTLAVTLGALLAESRTFEKFVFPFIVALQSTPKVAIAPLIMIWCGYGIASKIVMVALLCFFPLFVNTITGIRQTDPAMVNMMRAYCAPGWLTFYRVKIYAAASHIFAGLQVSVVFALLGAVVAEFVGSSMGLGWLIQSAMSNFNTPLMFASIITLIFLGLSLTSIVRLVQRKVLFWDKASKTTAMGRNDQAH
jgi:NitT/TauT family transport system permease protein